MPVAAPPPPSSNSSQNVPSKNKESIGDCSTWLMLLLKDSGLGPGFYFSGATQGSMVQRCWGCLFLYWSESSLKCSCMNKLVYCATVLTSYSAVHVHARMHARSALRYSALCVRVGVGPGRACSHTTHHAVSCRSCVLCGGSRQQVTVAGLTSDIRHIVTGHAPARANHMYT